VNHLKNAQNICVTDDDFKQQVNVLDKEKPVYVYCRSGKRSARAAEILKEMGFTKVYDLQGGIMEWQENDLETVN
jgi:rhodanese-related sulfurtransferase